MTAMSKINNVIFFNGPQINADYTHFTGLVVKAWKNSTLMWFCNNSILISLRPEKIILFFATSMKIFKLWRVKMLFRWLRLHVCDLMVFSRNSSSGDVYFIDYNGGDYGRLICVSWDGFWMEIMSSLVMQCFLVN